MGFFDGFRANSARLKQELEVSNIMAEYFQESYNDAARAILRGEDVGWTRMGGSPNDLTQIQLTEAKALSKQLHGLSESNPLLAQGLNVRISYLLSGQYQIGTREAETTISTQQRNQINKRKNQDAVFSMEALERIEAERYTAGQAFVLYDRSAKQFQHISFQEIGDIVYDPDDASEPWYVMRDWSAVMVGPDGQTQNVNKKMYYPVSTYVPDGGFAQVINHVQVDDTKRMIVDRVNVQAGANLGIPDSFAAAPWALAYSAYLSDGSKVLAALAEWAWVVKPKKRNPAERAAATVRNERGVGGTLFTDMDVQAMPTSNAVDLNTGRPLAGQAASALGISIILILADPGQSGAYGTAQTLSDPNRRTMETRRQRITSFLEHCLDLLGVKDPAILWPKMSPGSDDEESDIVMKAWGTGLFHEDEVRKPIADLANITILHADPPEGFLLPNNEKSLPRKDIDSDGSGVKPDGTTEMTNGQGRDNLGIGNLSHKSKADAETRNNKAK